MRYRTHTSSAEQTEIAEQKERLKVLGKQLGWGRAISPSVRFMAQKTNSEQIYDFFYHAASKSVHAGVSQLARMVWGEPNTIPNHGTFSITTTNFEGYYHWVNIVYGAWLFRHIVDVATDEFPEMWMGSDYQQYLRKITDVTANIPPMLTKEELQWPPK